MKIGDLRKPRWGWESGGGDRSDGSDWGDGAVAGAGRLAPVDVSAGGCRVGDVWRRGCRCVGGSREWGVVYLSGFMCFWMILLGEVVAGVDFVGGLKKMSYLCLIYVFIHIRLSGLVIGCLAGG